LSPIGVLLSCMPRVLCDVLSSVINEQPDMVVLDACVDAEALLANIHQLKPDVVVLGLGGSELSAMSEVVLSRAPELKIVAIEDYGRCASLVELRPKRTSVAEPSLEGFLQVIRFAVAGTASWGWGSGADRAALRGGRSREP
jgi:hypothetical protein